MVLGKKIDQVNVFAGSPWEVATVFTLLHAAYINASVKDEGMSAMKLMVPCEQYLAAVRVIGCRDNK